MCRLNAVGDGLDANLASAIHAATDITGFGLAGHAFNLARASGVSLQIELEQLPRFERAMEFLERGFLTKAHRTNAEYVKDRTLFVNESALLQQLTFDPQTSGGLLLAVDSASADRLLQHLQVHFFAARKIGVAGPESEILLRFT